MLFLQLKSGEYLTIGEDIAIQVFQNSGAYVRVGVSAPKDMTILRGEVLERNGKDRPACLYGQRSKKATSGPEGRPEPKPSEAGLVRRGEAAK